MPKSSRVQTILRYIGANVRRLRVARGWKQVDLAKAVGLHESQIQKIEGGRANPSTTALITLADVLGIAPTDLFAPTKVEERPAGRPWPKK